MEEIRVAGVGAGFFSAFQYDAWARIDGITLAAICDLDAARAKTMAQEHGAGAVFDDARAMLDDTRPDLFDIAVPPQSHLNMIRLGAERNTPMICQKPFCGSLGEAREAVAICEAAGVPLIVHENFRFQPWYRRIKATLDGGDLGQVYQATFRLRPGDGQGAEAYLDRQPYFQTMERFLIHETAIHFIDVFRYLFGDVSRVYADLARLNPHIAGEDAGTVLFDLASGIRAQFDGNRLADHPAANRRLTMGELTVEGEKGTLWLNGDGQLFFRTHGSNTSAEVVYPWNDHGFGGDCVLALQEHVVRFLRGEGEAENTARAYLANLEIEDAVYLSDVQGRAVTIPEPDAGA